MHYVTHILLILVIIWLCYDPSLRMWNRQGGKLIRILLTPLCYFGGYTLVFADVDRLKVINKATGNHFETNRLIAAGFRVRRGEFAWQVFGDEFAFLIRGDGYAFCNRIARQLALQPLSEGQREALAAIEGCSTSEAKLSATFAVYQNVRCFATALEVCSANVLAQKAKRDAAVL
jgi:GGDEF domain-containing protein